VHLPCGIATIELPPHHYAEHVGTLVITARPGETTLDARDSAALGDLATQVGGSRCPPVSRAADLN
jgi:hypothetical protein